MAMVNKATVDRVAIQERIRRELPDGCFAVLFKYLKPDADYSTRYIQGTVFKKYAAQVPEGADARVQTLTLDEWSVLASGPPRRITLNVVGDDFIDEFSSKVKIGDIVIVADFHCARLEDRWTHEDKPMQEILFTKPGSKFLHVTTQQVWGGAVHEMNLFNGSMYMMTECRQAMGRQPSE